MNSVGDNDPTLSMDKKVAIVGIGCRYPKDIKNVREFWKMIMAGEDCTRPHPKERLDPSYIYPDEKLPGKIYTRGGGYLSQNVTDFDRNFFQTSPEEADHMDPQLRLLLEVVWESLEDYGVNAANLRKSDTGVYIGVMTREYCNFLTSPDDNINQYTASGNNSNMMSNRVSYQFDFQGPSMTFDTACSSSLYAIHSACEAIRNGDCDLALAGGVNLLLQPATHIALCQARMVSPDGKCKSFDVSADGYSRGEGAGVLVLKSLKAAINDNDRVYAVVRGGALNNDGKTSGIIAPSADAQMMLLKRAYERSHVNPQEVAYVEAHGTGTQAGDKAEATALGNVMGNGRAKGHPPLIVGSVKSNMGHTEGAAGVAGVIKTSLVLQNKKIPKIVHFEKRNENVDWDNCKITFPTEVMEWPKGSKHIAGCSGFGFGGANAHLVLEAVPTSKNVKKSASQGSGVVSLLLLSAASKDALDQRVSDWLKFLSESSDDGTDFGDIVRTAATRATHHSYRLAIYSESLKQSIDVLKKKQSSPAAVKNMFAEGRVQTMPSGEVQKLVFVFSGMGTQWWGMGRQLMKTNPVFRDVIQEADKLLQEFGAKWSLVHLLTTETNREKINNTEIAQPSICALQIALAEVYRQLGIVPQAVIGHSVGEVAAACAAGYLSLRDALKLIYVRGKTLQRTTGKGTMAAILCRASDVREKLSQSEFQGKVDIACVNSPTQTVVSGDVDAVETFVNHFKTQGTRCVTLKVQNAFHSFQQEQIKDIFLENSKFLQNPTSGKCNNSHRQIPMISTVNGKFVSAKDLNSNMYWWQNIRQTVEFETSLMKMFEEGYDIFLEIGPHPSLASAIKGTMAKFSDSFSTSFHEDFAVIGSLKRPADLAQSAQDKNDILMSIAKLHVQGYPLNLELLYPNESFEMVSLPTYPWQRQQCVAITDAAKNIYLTPREKHPLLGAPITLFPEESDNMDVKVWKSNYGISAVPWLPHHKIENVVVLPGAAFIDMMLTVAKGIQTESDTATVEDVHFHKFHYSPDCKGSLSTTARRSHGSNQWQVAIRTFNENSDSWTQNATCCVSVPQSKVNLNENYSDLDEIQNRCEFQITPASFYTKLAENGVQIGNLFGCITAAHYNVETQEALVFASLPKTIKNEVNEFIFHPALLDATFQLFAGFSFVGQSSKFGSDVRVPKSAGSVSVKGQAPPNVFIHGKTIIDGSKKTVNLTIGDSRDGKIFAKMQDIKFAAVGSNKHKKGVQVWDKEWVPIDASSGTSTDNAVDVPSTSLKDLGESDYLVIPDRVGVAGMFVDCLHKKGVPSKMTHTCDLSEDINMVGSQNRNDHNRNVVVLTFLNDSEIDPLNGISKERYMQSQVDDVTSLIKMMTDLNSESEPGTQSIWIITKGAVAACPSDTAVNPLMSNGYSLVMTFMNEFPELFVTTIDLPHKQSAKDSARWLSKFFQDPVRSENCLALRSCDKISNDGTEFQMFSLRLNIKPASDLFIRQKSDKWMIDLSESSANNLSQSIKPIKDESHIIENQSPKCSEISIQVEAFAKQYCRSASNPKEPSTGFLFGGTVVRSSKSSDKFKTGCQVLGYSRSHIVTPVLIGDTSDLVPIPSNVKPADAISILQTYFPLFIALQGTLELPEGSLVMMTSNDVNKDLAFAKQLAITKNMKVVIYVQDSEQLPKFCGKNNSVSFASKQSVNMVVKKCSVSTLLLHRDIKLNSNEADVLFSKLHFHGTVAVLGNTPIKSNMITARQIGVRYVEPEYMWDPENSTLTSELIGSLLKLFFFNGHRIESLKNLVETVQVDDVIGSQKLGGKVVTANPIVNVPFGFDEAERLFMSDPTSSYLVVGGTKGIGFEIVRWLVSQGAKCVYISGRNAPEKDISQEMDQMRKRGINLKFIKCDVTNEIDTEKMLVNINSQGRFPLTGVFHCAAGFEDERLDDVTKKGWAKVLLPKAYGLLLLHKLTSKLEMPLKIFAGISSIVQYLGNDGQCNYFSANTFMSSFCEARRLKGLPATVIAPGAISDVGYAARSGFDKFWENRGIRSLVPSEVVNSLAWLLVNDTQEIGVTGEIDKESFFKVKTETFKREAKRNQFSVFKKEFPVEFLSRVLNDSSNLLASLNSTEAKTLIEEFLVDFVRQRLGISDQISTGVSLSSFGFDSAMSWELSGVIRSKFNVDVTSVELLNDTMKISDIGSLMYKRATSTDTKPDAA